MLCSSALVMLIIIIELLMTRSTWRGGGVGSALVEAVTNKLQAAVEAAPTGSYNQGVVLAEVRIRPCSRCACWHALSSPSPIR